MYWTSLGVAVPKSLSRQMLGLMGVGTGLQSDMLYIVDVVMLQGMIDVDRVLRLQLCKAHLEMYTVQLPVQSMCGLIGPYSTLRRSRTYSGLPSSKPSGCFT